jgi:hypothetical protein
MTVKRTCMGVKYGVKYRQRAIVRITSRADCILHTETYVSVCDCKQLCIHFIASPRYVHTVNGTAMANTRTMIAVLEQMFLNVGFMNLSVFRIYLKCFCFVFQPTTVVMPAVLQPFMPPTNDTTATLKMMLSNRRTSFTEN